MSDATPGPLSFCGRPAGRPKKYATPEEAREARNAARRAKARERGVPPRVPSSPTRRRQQKAESKRRRRESDPRVLAKDAEAKRLKRAAVFPFAYMRRFVSTSVDWVPSGHHCAVLGCTNNYRKRQIACNVPCSAHKSLQGECGCNVFKLHRFPNDKELRRQWVAAVNRKDFCPSPFSRVCSRHFTHGVRTENSVPTVNMGYTRKEHFGPEQFQMAPRRTGKEKEKNANDEQDDSEVQESEAILPDDGPDVQSDSDTQESKSILPDDGPGWGSSSDNSLMQAVTIKTEPPDYVEQDEEPSSHLVSVKSEPECYEEVREPNSLVPALTKDYTNVTKVTFHLDAEPQVSEDAQRRCNRAVDVKMEPPDPTELHTKAASTGTDVQHDFAAQQSGTIPANARLGLCSKSYPNGSELLRRILLRGKTDGALMDAGLDGSSKNAVMTAITIKTEPPEYVEQDEEPSSHLVSVTSEPECYEEVWKPGNPVPALTKDEPPDHTDVTKVTFHTNPELQVSKEALQRGNAAVAVKIEPQDPTEVDAPAVSLGAGSGAASSQEVGQHWVLEDPTVAVWPPGHAPPAVCDELRPQPDVIKFREIERS
ncbi:uncharacterized protein LOC115329815 [Ixodes scapularis]|uniref:uncharacterized protein LOC115329815 n=1 Tax=Ixodes scapularis TaxID=6945 RepID=UPI001A9FF974|nr:uncharacterized protein LOC115329815 [Ixodes scapularis]